jgi:hypothetical protein
MKGIFIKGTDIQVRGTLERAYGVAKMHVNDEGKPAYTGETSLFDDQVTVTDKATGHTIWIDVDGNEHVAAEVEVREVPDDYFPIQTGDDGQPVYVSPEEHAAKKGGA